MITIKHEGERPSRVEINLAICEVISLRGTCLRKQVGALLTSIDGRIISSGYNGSIIRGKHCGELNCDIEAKCTHSVHAEQNAIAYAAKKGITLEGSILYCSTAPCYQCAKVIYQAGVARVIYREEYSDDLGLLLLKELGIPYVKA